MLLLAAAVIGHGWLIRGPDGRPAPAGVSTIDRLPSAIGPWNAQGEAFLEPEVLLALGPDQYIIRNYRGSRGEPVSLFVAYFGSQDRDRGPHSPRDCLPASGWKSVHQGDVEIPSGGGQVTANLYEISKGDERGKVLYWYQNSRRAVQRESAARFYLLADAFQNRGTDISLIRIIAPVLEDGDRAALDRARAFAAHLLEPLREHLPR
ncbi:MAG: EpsI family protein [Bryobacteraceae bacterium]|nr:EpsI family protein [Bryobacteraceae bacterium]